MHTAPPRRRFRFSLRMMFVALTTGCIVVGWTGHQLNWIRQRHAIAANQDTVHFFGGPANAPFPLWLFGEQGKGGILVHTDSKEERERVGRLFPEAVLVKAVWTHDPPTD